MLGKGIDVSVSSHASETKGGENEIILLQVLDLNSEISHGRFVLGSITDRIFPSVRMAAIIGDEAFIGLASYVDSERFRIGDHTFYFYEIDSLAYVRVPKCWEI
jgi:hypothetical protein